MLRITTGIAKNKRLKIPDIEGFRGVQEKAKLALFSILGDKVKGAVCLDLFAGSGNLGIEALSRGAARCDFVDENSVCTEAIESNLNDCGFLELAEVFRKTAVKYVANCTRNYDVIFLDPFYTNTNNKHLFKSLLNILNNSGQIFYFHANNLDVKELLAGNFWEVKDNRRFGESIFELIEKKKD